MKHKLSRDGKALEKIKNELLRILAITVSFLMAIPAIPVNASDITDSVTPACDEAYYATLDYYGNLKDGSIVKSYTLNGASSLTDFGQYDSITNLTDNTKPMVDGGKVTFQLADHSTERFYFEGKTTQPFSQLPWTLSMSYRLNGVPKKAEELAGQTGVVEININAVPNQQSSEYARNNETLEAVAAFNADDILSLEAPGAQVQMLGNLRVVLFIVLPGEEQHFTIRVGTNSFSFNGMNFLIAPATLSQLSKIKDLRTTKSDLEQSYNDAKDSLTSLLDAVDGMSDSLNETADGLDQLNQARQSISDGKGQVYEDFDEARQDLRDIGNAMEPAEGHLESASDMLNSLRKNLNSMDTALLEIRSDLENARSLLANLEKIRQGAAKEAYSLSAAMEDLDTQLSELETAFGNLKSSLDEVSPLTEELLGNTTIEVDGTQYTVSQIKEYLNTAQQLYAAYQGAVQAGAFPKEGTFEQFIVAYLEKNGIPEDEAAQKAALLSGLYNQKDEIEAELGAASKLIGNLSSLSSDTEDVISSLRKLKSDDTDTLISSLISGAGAGNEIGDSLLSNVEDLIDQIDAVENTLDDYEPDIQDTINDTIELSNALRYGIKSLNTFLTAAENLLKDSGSKLDAGTKQALEGLAATLRKSASGLASTDKLRKAKNSITSLIEDKWKEYTGQDNNILLMDPDAAPVSLTSSDNQTPSSVQILIRSQEIKVEKGKNTAVENVSVKKTTFLDRVTQMFTDFWHAVTSLF